MQIWTSPAILLGLCAAADAISPGASEWRGNTLSGTLSKSFIVEVDAQVVNLEYFRQFDVKNQKAAAQPVLAAANSGVDYMPWGQPGGFNVTPASAQRRAGDLYNPFTAREPWYSPFRSRYARISNRADSGSDDWIAPIYFAIRQEFPNKRLFFGFSVTLEHAYDLSVLRHMRGVKSVTPITFIRRPVAYGNKVQLVSKPSQHQLLDCKNNLAMTGVDKLHAAGIDGRGIKVAIIDTGVDYTHPALGGCFGKGCKVSFGFDFVGDEYDGANDPAPDANPFSQIGMYRVFGCQGGTADDLLMKAMEAAFEDNADVLSISVGAPAGWTETPTARMASNIAKEGRIVSVASGNDGAVGMFFPSSPAVGKDVIAVGSIDSALFTAFNATVLLPGASPIPYFAPRAFRLPAMPVYATAADATAPRDACDPLPEYVPDLSPFVVLVRRGGCSLDVKYRNVVASGGKTILLWNSALPPIYLEPGYGITNAAMIGASDGAWILDQLQSGITVKLLFPDSGPTTVANNLTGGTVSTFSSYGPTFDLLPPTDVSAPGGLILSTWPVPLGNYSILSGTSMAAPFTAAAAALLLQAQRQGKMGSAVPLGARDIIDRLRTTALPASNSTKGIFLETVAKQGSGLLQVDKAVTYTTVINPARLLLNDTRTPRGTQTFNITNGSPDVLTYTLEHEAAGTAITFPIQRFNYQNLGPVPMVSTAASVKISPRQLSLDPGETFTVSVNFAFPQSRDVDPGLFPVFSGFIRVSSSNNEALTVSYMGLGSDLTTIKMLDDKSGMSKNYALPALLIGDTGKVQRLPRVYTFENGDFPVLQFRLIAGSRLTRIDIIESVAQVRPEDVPFLGPVGDQDAPSVSVPDVQTSTDLPVPLPTDANDVLAPFTRRSFTDRYDVMPPMMTDFPGSLGRIIPPNRRNSANDGLRSFNASRVVGPITSAALLPRNSFDQNYGIYAVIWDGTVGGVGRVQAGEYKILLRTLRIGAAVQDDDVQSESDPQDDATSNDRRWEEWLSPIIRVPRSQ
ncbi:hypothetical protein OC845_005428 [Tilletia horrida]|nr:hypothetical protein OC845_005428 [Tilletia horrida]